jgi:hypothetical protein
MSCQLERTELKIILLLFALLLALGPALAEHTQACQGRTYSVADGFSTVCSATWQFSALCTGRDMWEDWKIAGPPFNPPDSFVRPWLDTPITIVGYELVKVRGMGWAFGFKSWLRSWLDLGAWSAFVKSLIHPDSSWFMVGSAMQPDAMIWMAPGETHSKQMWPAGQGQPWPKKADANPARLADLLDLHGTCYRGSVFMFLTIYYVPP